MSKLRTWVRGGSSQGKAGYWLEFAYDATVIEQLKKTIPSYLREWDEEKKRWWVSEYCEKQIDDCFPGFLMAVISQRRLF